MFATTIGGLLFASIGWCWFLLLAGDPGLFRRTDVRYISGGYVLIALGFAAWVLLA